MADNTLAVIAFWLTSFAATANGASLSQVLPWNHDAIPAFACAKPSGTLIDCVVVTDNREHPVGFPRNVLPVDRRHAGSPYRSHSWFFDCIFETPSCAQTASDTLNRDIKDFAPFSDGFDFSFVPEPFVSAVIPRLRFVGCPAAISRLIVPIVVNSVKRCVLWSFPHVFEKVFKDLPSFANLYSSPTVPMETGRFFIVAATFHGCPTSVSWCSNHPVLCDCVDVGTTATCGCATFKRMTKNCLGVSAFAFAEPSGLNSYIFTPTDYGPATKLSPCQVNESWHHIGPGYCVPLTPEV